MEISIRLVYSVKFISSTISIGNIYLSVFVSPKSSVDI